MFTKLVLSAGAKQVVHSLRDLAEGKPVCELTCGLTEASEKSDGLARLDLDVAFELPVPSLVDSIFGIVVEDKVDDLIVGCVSQIWIHSSSPTHRRESVPRSGAERPPLLCRRVPPPSSTSANSDNARVVCDKGRTRAGAAADEGISYVMIRGSVAAILRV